MSLIAIADFDWLQWKGEPIEDLEERGQGFRMAGFRLEQIAG